VDGVITISDPRAIALIAGVVLFLAVPRLLPRFLVGFRCFLSPTEVERRRRAEPDLLLLDVRTPGEFFGPDGRLPGSWNVPLHGLTRALDKADDPLSDPDRPVVAVCQSDLRAGQAVLKLRKAGFRRVWVLSGGVNAWLEDRLPVEEGPPAHPRQPSG
jgi:rhodanese-related sulfurtransferase